MEIFKRLEALLVLFANKLCLMHACMLHIVCLVIADPVMAESSEIQYHEDNCVICVDPEVDEKLVRVRKGIDTLIEYSQKRNRITLHEYLCRRKSELQPKKVFVHESCRRDFKLFKIARQWKH